MSTTRHPGPFSGGSTPPRTSALPAQIAPPNIAADAPPQVHLPLCSVIGAMIEVAQRDGDAVECTAHVRGRFALALFVRSMPRVFGFALGWSPAQLDLLASLDVSLARETVSAVVASFLPAVTVGETSGVRHRLYSDGVRKAPKPPSLMDRYRAQARDLGIERKAVA